MAHTLSHSRTFVLTLFLAPMLLAAQEKPGFDANLRSGVAAVTDGNYGEALNWLTAAAEQAKALPPLDIRQAKSAYMLAMTYQYLGRLDRAEPLYLEAQRVLDTGRSGGGDLLAFTLDGLGQIRFDQQRWAEAEALLRESADLCKRSHGENTPCAVNATLHLGEIYAAEGRLADAADIFRNAIAAIRANSSSPAGMLAAALRNLANIYMTEGRYASAEPLLTEALELARRLGESNPVVGDTLLMLGRLHRLEHQSAQAEPLLRKAIRIFETSGDRSLPGALNELGLLAIDEGKFQTAKELLERSLSIYSKVLGPENVLLTMMQIELAEANLGERNVSRAESLVQSALAKERQIESSPYALAWLHMVAGRVAEERHRSAEADVHYRRAIILYRQIAGSSHPDLLEAERRYARFAKGLRRSNGGR
ncbi:MAG TPA: tetratricopeptide repeat protein [Bryobacteraceae bacterium]|nr:tetratricopeptide repeat protein [Bryobacteraceae bacterium]